MSFYKLFFKEKSKFIMPLPFVSAIIYISLSITAKKTVVLDRDSYFFS